MADFEKTDSASVNAALHNHIMTLCQGRVVFNRQNGALVFYNLDGTDPISFSNEMELLTYLNEKKVNAAIIDWHVHEEEKGAIQKCYLYSGVRWQLFTEHFIDGLFFTAENQLYELIANHSKFLGAFILVNVSTNKATIVFDHAFIDKSIHPANTTRFSSVPYSQLSEYSIQEALKAYEDRGKQIFDHENTPWSWAKIVGKLAGLVAVMVGGYFLGEFLLRTTKSRFSSALTSLSVARGQDTFLPSISASIFSSFKWSNEFGYKTKDNERIKDFAVGSDGNIYFATMDGTYILVPSGRKLNYAGIIAPKNGCSPIKLSVDNANSDRVYIVESCPAQSEHFRIVGGLPNNPIDVGTSTGQFFSGSVFISNNGQFAFFRQGNGCIVDIYSLTDGSNIRRVATYAPPSSTLCYDMAFDEDFEYFYTVGSNKVEVVDVSNPTRPSFVMSLIKVGADFKKVTLRGEHGVVMSCESGDYRFHPNVRFYTFDKTNPSEPFYIGKSPPYKSSDNICGSSDSFPRLSSSENFLYLSYFRVGEFWGNKFIILAFNQTSNMPEDEADIGYYSTVYSGYYHESGATQLTLVTAQNESLYLSDFDKIVVLRESQHHIFLFISVVVVGISAFGFLRCVVPQKARGYCNDEGGLLEPASRNKNERRPLLSPTTQPTSDLTFQIRQLTLKEVVIGDQIGSGASGRVYKGRYRNQDVAVKHLQADSYKKFIQEVRSMANIRSNYIIMLFGVIPARHYLVMEYMSKGSLYEILKKNRNLDLNTRRKFALDIAHGLLDIHDSGLIHRDLKSLNILIDGNGHAKIGDFGLSIDPKSQSQDTTYLRGTLPWMAPEILNTRVHSQKSDIYSFGQILRELVIFCTPFSHISDIADIRTAIQNGQHASLPADTPGDLRTMIEQCTANDPNARPSLASIIKELEQHLPETQPAVLPGQVDEAPTIIATREFPTPSAPPQTILGSLRHFMWGDNIPTREYPTPNAPALTEDRPRANFSLSNICVLQ